jgi:hypothetical protein
VLRDTGSTTKQDGVVHPCDGIPLEVGTAITWTVCGNGAGLMNAGDDAAGTRCRAIQSAGRVINGTVLSCGPPDLVSSSLPRSLQ